MNFLIFLSPVLLLGISAVFLLLLEIYVKNKKFKNYLAFFITFFSIIVSIILFIYEFFLLKEPLLFLGDSLLWDRFNISFIIVVSSVACLVIVSSYLYILSFYENISEYCSLYLLLVIGMYFLILSNDILSFFISFEIISLSFYILVGVFRINDIKSSESSIKYMILGSFASAFFLLGLSFIYGGTGEIKFYLIANANPSNQFIYLGLIFVFIVFLFKIGVFPFHQWLPDVYQGAPMIVTAFMATAGKIALFAVFIKWMFYFIDVYNFSVFISLLNIICIFTMVFGNLMALLQSNIKRLLAYSSIGHTGYLLMAVLSLSWDYSSVYVSTILFYLLVYSFILTGIFSILMGFSKEGRDIETFEDLRGLAYQNKYMGVFLAFFFFSLAGIPSTAGFMAKFFIFRQALDSNLYLISIIGIFMAIVSIYYYLKAIVFIYLKDVGRHYLIQKVSFLSFFVALAVFMFTIILGFFPQIYFDFFKVLNILH